MTPEIDVAAINAAVEVLERGGLVAMPTETVYGLAADADNEAAVLSSYQAKGRPLNHPLIVHVCGPEALDHWAQEIPESARMLTAKSWPGPLRLVLKKKPRCGLFVTGGQDTVALRCPSHPWAHALLTKFAGPTYRGVTAPSANTFGRISPSCAAHVAEDLGLKPEGKLDLILDGGTCEFGIESTMLDLSTGKPRLLRHGVISRAELEAALGVPVPDAGSDAPRVSGGLKSHYAPRTKLELVDADEMLERAKALKCAGDTVAVMAGKPVLERLAAADIVPVLSIESPADVKAYGALLYDALHRLDHAGAKRILIERPAADPAWAAVADRLGRAAA